MYCELMPLVTLLDFLWQLFYWIIWHWNYCLKKQLMWVICSLLGHEFFYQNVCACIFISNVMHGLCMQLIPNHWFEPCPGLCWVVLKSTSYSVYITLIVPLSELSSKQASPTKTTWGKLNQIHGYIATNSDATVKFNQRGFMLKTHWNESYIYLPK